METSTIIWISIIGFVLGLIITYHIIRSAVKSAMEEQATHIRSIYRIQMRKMIEAGYDKADMSKLKNDDEGTFWDSLSSKLPEK
jgi:uncharacterized membrane-anchored protein YhcB (DUF1043 family)